MINFKKIIKYLGIVCCFVVAIIFCNSLTSVKFSASASAEKELPSISKIASATYTGKSQVPTIKILDGSDEVGADNYTLSYRYKKIDADNSEYSSVEEPEFINAGVYEITATAQGEVYTGSSTTTYTINKADVTNEQFYFATTAIEKNSNDENFTNELTNYLGLKNVVYSIVKSNDKTEGISVDENTGEITLAHNAEKETLVSVVAKFLGDDNYNPAQTSYTLKVTNKFTITWIIDGVSQAEVFDYGDNLIYAKGLSNPVKISEDDFEYSYTFSRWEPIIENEAIVTEDRAYTAIFNKIKRTYLITFKLEDDSIIETIQVEYGKTPVCSVVPTKAGNDLYKYEFTGWTPTITTVTGPATYVGKFVARTLVLKSNSVGDETSVAEIISQSGIYEGSSFEVKQMDEISFATPKNCENIASYSAKLVYGVVPIELGEKVRIKVYVEDIAKTNSIKVAIKNTDGDIELLDVTFDEDGNLYFETNKISDFMIVKDCGNLLATCLISFALIFVCVCVLTIILIPMLKKQEHTTSVDEPEA